MSLLLPNGQPLPTKPTGQVLIEALATNTIFALQRELAPFLDSKFYSVLGPPVIAGTTINLGLPGETELPVLLKQTIRVQIPVLDPDHLIRTPEARSQLADNMVAAFMQVLAESPGADHEVFVMRPIPTTYCGPMMVQGATEHLAATFSLGVDNES